MKHRVPILVLSLTVLAVLSSCAKQKKGYDKIGKLVQSLDGSSEAFQAIRGEEQFIVFNGKELRSYDKVFRPIISPDGKKVAYGARRDGRWFYVVDGKEGKAYEQVNEGYFGKDGRNFAYEVKVGNKWRIVINENESPLYDDAGVWDFTPDHQLYTAKRNGKEFVVWRGVEGKPYDRLSEPRISPTGQKLAYVAYQGSDPLLIIPLLVIDDREYPQQDYGMLGEVEWSSDETKITFLGRRKLGGAHSLAEERVVVNATNGEKIRSERLTPGFNWSYGVGESHEESR